tara:strand:+ start:59 stop:403 length:345 start_codon:yes stop_codon:yes gene_type:complete
MIKYSSNGWTSLIGGPDPYLRDRVNNFFDECTVDITMPEGWKDISYGNDACPSWSFNGYQVFIDHPDPNERELGSETSRFYVILEKEYGTHQTWFHDCDTWDEVLDTIKKREKI